MITDIDTHIILQPVVAVFTFKHPYLQNLWVGQTELLAYLLTRTSNILTI